MIKQNEISLKRKVTGSKISTKYRDNWFDLVSRIETKKIIDNLQLLQNPSPYGSNVHTEISERLQIRWTL